MTGRAFRYALLTALVGACHPEDARVAPLSHPQDIPSAPLSSHAAYAPPSQDDPEHTLDLDTVVPESRPDTFYVRIHDVVEFFENHYIRCTTSGTAVCRHLNLGLFEIDRGEEPPGSFFLAHIEVFELSDTMFSDTVPWPVPDTAVARYTIGLRVNHAPRYYGPDPIRMPNPGRGRILHSREFGDEDGDSIQIIWVYGGGDVEVRGPKIDPKGEKYWLLSWRSENSRLGWLDIQLADPYEEVGRSVSVCALRPPRPGKPRPPCGH